jgi:hypothetical protein
MTGDNGSRHFVKTWWALAFMLGAVSGTAAVTLAGVSYAVWGIAGLGLPIVALVAILERLSGRSLLARRSAHSRWRQPLRTSHAQPQSRTTKGKMLPGRGQLRAIAGRKRGEPPSSGTS